MLTPELSPRGNHGRFNVVRVGVKAFGNGGLSPRTGVRDGEDGWPGHVRIMTTGASPIAPEVMEFLRICFGAIVMEGYGMTETTCIISVTHTDDASTGHVGPPLSCIEIKLVDLPEMNYTTADKPFPRGEVSWSLAKPCVFIFYLFPLFLQCCGLWMCISCLVTGMYFLFWSGVEMPFFKKAPPRLICRSSRLLVGHGCLHNPI